MPRTVKFCHPGGAWKSLADSGAAGWATGVHSRRYIETKGRYLPAPGGPVQEGLMGFWGEYEAPTRFRRLAAARRAIAGDMPAFVHTPLAPGARPERALNTDPLVVGSHWLYSNCRQGSQPRLRQLERGDVLLFGSLVARQFVLDTVFVIGEALPYRAEQARGFIGSRVPEHAYRLVLDLVKPGEYTLYVGATYESPVDGRFSFVPAAPAGEYPLGFPRLAAPAALQSLQAMGVKYLDGPCDYWAMVAAAVFAAGLCLGVAADLPSAQ